MQPTHTSGDQSIRPEDVGVLRHRIKNSVVIEDRGYMEPCWRSMTSAHPKGGYARIGIDGQTWLAHRLAYLVFVGEIPPLMRVRHKCGLNSCCNPAHLTLARSGKTQTVLPDDEPMKVCVRCEEARPKDEFSADSARGDGLAAYCRGCRASYARRSYRNRTPEAQARHKRRHDAWQKANKDKVARSARTYSLKRNYGLTYAEYEAMLAAQGNVCAICGAPDGRNGKSFHVDHCHETGAVRGILCSTCNVSIGGLKDDPALLRRAAGYLESAMEKA